MVWTLDALATLSLSPTELQLFPPPYDQDVLNHKASGTATEPPRVDDGYSVGQNLSCRCGYEEAIFCPYCEHDRTSRRLETGISTEVDSSLADEESSGAARPRKLRKFRPEHPQIRYEALDVESLLSARPNSILSTHSALPLLNTGLFPIAERKTPNKLEKKRHRCSSAHSSPSSSSSNIIATSKPRNVQVVKSKHFLTTRKSQPFGPRPKPASSSIETDALVSLAWTGEVRSSFKSSDLVLPVSAGQSSIVTYSPTSLSHPTSSEDSTTIITNSLQSNTSGEKRPTVLRKPKDVDALKKLQPRPWTLAMAITDDGVTDEKLVEDLENMRIKERTYDPVIPDPYPFVESPSPPAYSSQLFDSFAEYPLQSGEVIQDLPSSLNLSWGAARQALLLCRELVRTERRYLASLKILISNGTTTPPPPLMLSHLPGLITASDALLTLMEENPSVQGVSQALLSCQDDLNDSFVSWCSVVGQFFNEEGSKNKAETEDVQQPQFLAMSPRSLSAESNLSIVVPEPNKIRKNIKARPTVRDLAILPTQRIMRYVLLFKELHSLTPITLSSFSFVESAMRVAESIAHNANMAQNHITFK